MLIEILSNLPYLFLLMGANIALGTYYNISTIKENFSWLKLLTGVVKAFIIALSFSACALAVDKVINLTNAVELEVAPDLLMLTSIAYYLSSTLGKLHKILIPTQED